MKRGREKGGNCLRKRKKEKKEEKRKREEMGCIKG
jgi:hypothetical protein